MCVEAQDLQYAPSPMEAVTAQSMSTSSNLFFVLLAPQSANQVRDQKLNFNKAQINLKFRFLITLI